MRRPTSQAASLAGLMLQIASGPPRYKDLDSIVTALVQAGLGSVSTSFRPVIPYKTCGGTE